MLAYVQKKSFFPAAGEGGGRPLLVNLALLAVIRLVTAQHHRRLACILGVVVPNWLFVACLLALRGFLLLPETALALPQHDAALVVVGVETWVRKQYLWSCSDG